MFESSKGQLFYACHILYEMRAEDMDWLNTVWPVACRLTGLGLRSEAEEGMDRGRHKANWVVELGWLVEVNRLGPLGSSLTQRISLGLGYTPMRDHIGAEADFRPKKMRGKSFEMLQKCLLRPINCWWWINHHVYHILRVFNSFERWIVRKFQLINFSN